MGSEMCIRDSNKIYIVKNAKINHLGGKSHSTIYETEIEYSRNWHWMWSKFYFNKKHSGYLSAIINSLPSFLSAVLKFFLYSLLNHRKKNIYFHRASGFLSAFLGKKSYFRPKIKNQ